MFRFIDPFDVWQDYEMRSFSQSIPQQNAQLLVDANPSRVVLWVSSRVAVTMSLWVERQTVSNQGYNIGTATGRTLILAYNEHGILPSLKWYIRNEGAATFVDVIELLYKPQREF